MRPNDLPIVCLLLKLSDEAAAALVDFLHELTEALERHYCGQLLRYAQRYDPLLADGQPTPDNIDPDDPPF